ncbi:hypothetical protein KM043_009594 [Ampulex compressa]|nr:hypothetical protein KM043_009594 [Ampulex compressa]
MVVLEGGLPEGGYLAYSAFPLAILKRGESSSSGSRQWFLRGGECSGKEKVAGNLGLYLWLLPERLSREVTGREGAIIAVKWALIRERGKGWAWKKDGRQVRGGWRYDEDAKGGSRKQKANERRDHVGVTAPRLRTELSVFPSVFPQAAGGMRREKRRAAASQPRPAPNEFSTAASVAA